MSVINCMDNLICFVVIEDVWFVDLEVLECLFFIYEFFFNEVLVW